MADKKSVDQVSVIGKRCYTYEGEDKTVFLLSNNEHAYMDGHFAGDAKQLMPVLETGNDGETHWRLYEKC